MGYRKQLHDLSRWLKLLLPSLPGACGNAAADAANPAYFAMLIPWLLLTATVLFILQPVLSRMLGTKSN